MTTATTSNPSYVPKQPLSAVQPPAWNGGQGVTPAYGGHHQVSSEGFILGSARCLYEFLSSLETMYAIKESKFLEWGLPDYELKRNKTNRTVHHFPLQKK